MSRKTNVGKKPTLRDYGIQPYRACDKEYSDVMRTATFKAAHDAVVIRESEFAKPYGDVEEVGEDYSGMEYPAPRIPPPGNDYPGMGLPVPDFGEIYNPWHLTFYCSPDLCWCEGEQKCATANCTYEIVKVEFAYFSYPEWSLTWTKNRICITAPADASGSPSINITMRANIPKGGGLWQRKFDVVYGTHGNISVSECRASECCSGTVTAWDYVNSAATIGQSANTIVYVTGSGTELEWSVSGTGFFFDAGLSLTTITTGASTTLYTNASACGAATITVTDCASNVVTGYIRCTVGVWTTFNAHDFTTSDCGKQGACGTTSYYYTDPGHRVICWGDQTMIRINIPEGCDSSNGFNREEITATAPDGVTISLDGGEAYDKEGRLASICFSNTQVGGTRLIGIDCSEQYFECA